MSRITDAKYGLEHEFDADGNHLPRATFDYTESGALMLSYPRDEAFTALLRQVVPVGFITFSRQPYCWIIDADYAKDALALAYRFWDNVEQDAMD